MDTETTGLDPRKDQLRTIQVGDQRCGFVIPADVALTDTEWLYHHEWWFFNAPFDLAFLERAGVDTSRLRWRDARILAHLVDSRGAKDGGPGHSFTATLESVGLTEKFGEDKQLMKEAAKAAGVPVREFFAKVPLDNELFIRYATNDVVALAHMVPLLQQRVNKLWMGHLVDWEHEVMEACMYMSTVGLLVDDTVVAAKREEQRKIHQEAVQEAQHWGVSSLGSPLVAEIIAADGIKLPKTPTGKPSVKGLGEGVHPLGDVVLRGKHAKKLDSTYLSKLHGVVHPKITTLAAVTARMSVSDPPLQQLPSGDSYIRDCIVARPGHTLVSVDYSSQELRMLAVYCGAGALQRQLKSGADLHQITADSAGVSRSTGKMANFLAVYGGGPAALASQAGISYPKAKRVIAALGKQWPEYKFFSESAQAAAERRGYVVTKTGRRIVLRTQHYRAVNYLVQSASRDVTAAAITRVWRSKWGQYMRLPVHDEVLYEVPTELVEQFKQEVPSLMETTIEGVHFPVDVDVHGDRWGNSYG
ncbi:DNA polymerase [Corynebacterium durum]|uniref:DNA polymerase n=1 Tax=Corynebacterium durum TaxID=61592 RepID=UPI002889165B|nr:DNA polymerase [Corynebacterium durum]